MNMVDKTWGFFFNKGKQSVDNQYPTIGYDNSDELKALFKMYTSLAIIWTIHVDQNMSLPPLKHYQNRLPKYPSYKNTKFIG
jgi:hypothetical protein